MRTCGKKTFVFALVAAFIVAGCAPAQEEPTATPAALGDFPTGSFGNTLQSWSLEIRADGSFLASGMVMSERGQVNVSGSQITFKGDFCPNVVGTYEWTWDGAQLSFKSLGDECTERAAVLVNGSWEKR